MQVGRSMAVHRHRTFLHRTSYVTYSKAVPVGSDEDFWAYHRARERQADKRAFRSFLRITLYGVLGAIVCTAVFIGGLLLFAPLVNALDPVIQALIGGSGGLLASMIGFYAGLRVGALREKATP